MIASRAAGLSITHSSIAPKTNEPSILVYEVKKFNWGAFFLTPIWLMSHRRFAAGVMVALFNLASHTVDQLGTGAVIGSFIIGLGISWHFGRQGNRIAMESGKFGSLEELRRSQRTWAGVGLVLTGIMFIVNLASFFVTM